MATRKSALRARGEAIAANSTEVPRPAWAKVVSVVLFVVLALLALESLRLGVGGLYGQLAQFDMDRWSPISGKLPAADVVRAEKRLFEGFRITPDNPSVLERLGVLDLAKMRAAGSPRVAVALTRDARLRFRQALRERPTSPFIWANLALAKLYLNEFDDEFFAALRHAEELGPWEPVVQQWTVFAGLAAWPQLDAGLREALMRMLERGALRNAEKMAQIVKSYRRMDLLCGISKYNAIVGADCAKIR